MTLSISVHHRPLLKCCHEARGEKLCRVTVKMNK